MIKFLREPQQAEQAMGEASASLQYSATDGEAIPTLGNISDESNADSDTQAWLNNNRN